MFLFQYQQSGGAMNQRLSRNVLRRRRTTYYSIIFQQDRNFCDFYDEEIVDSFFNSIKKFIVSDGNDEFKMEGYAEIINFQQTEIAELEILRP